MFDQRPPTDSIRSHFTMEKQAQAEPSTPEPATHAGCGCGGSGCGCGGSCTCGEKPQAPVDVEDLAYALDAASRKVAAIEDEQAQAAMSEWREANGQITFHALANIVRTLRELDPSQDTLFALLEDPTIRLAFGMHGIIRLPDVNAPDRPPQTGTPGAEKKTTFSTDSLFKRP